MMILAEMIQTAANGSLLALVIGMGLCLVRLIRGPTLADRVVALDLITILAAGAMAALTLGHDEPAYVSVALVISLVAFLATVALALYINQQTENPEDTEDQETENER